MRRIAVMFVSALGLVVLSVPPASAASFEADYSVTLYGLPIATARFATSFEGQGYSVEGSLRSSGVARLFDRTSGTVRVHGAVGPNGVSPLSYLLEYSSGGKRGKTTISFAEGGVASATNEPPPRRRRNWVAVSDGDLRSVLDPISSTLVRANEASEVCGRTLRVFDGELRADLTLTHARTGPISGFQGEAATCSVSFEPVAGYRPGRSQMEYLRNRSTISVSFLPLGETGFYAPVEASIGTQVGTILVRAVKITVR